jgi:hypothetical protein
MRHLWSLIAGVVLAPIVWAVAAYGQAVTARVSANGAPTSFESKLLIAAAAFVGAGLVFGIIGTLRVSPLGPLVAGVAYLGSYAVAVFAPVTAHDIFERMTKVGDYEVHYATAVTSGLIPVLGAALLMAVFSPGRWRTWPAPAGAEPVGTTPVSPAGTVGEPSPSSFPDDDEPRTEPTPTASTTSSWTTPYSSTTDTTERRDDDTSPWGPPPGTR